MAIREIKRLLRLVHVHVVERQGAKTSELGFVCEKSRTATDVSFCIGLHSCKMLVSTHIIHKNTILDRGLYGCIAYLKPGYWASKERD